VLSYEAHVLDTQTSR